MAAGKCRGCPSRGHRGITTDGDGMHVSQRRGGGGGIIEDSPVSRIRAGRMSSHDALQVSLFTEPAATNTTVTSRKKVKWNGGKSWGKSGGAGVRSLKPGEPKSTISEGTTNLTQISSSLQNRLSAPAFRRALFRNGWGRAFSPREVDARYSWGDAPRLVWCRAFGPLKSKMFEKTYVEFDGR